MSGISRLGCSPAGKPTVCSLCHPHDIPIPGRAGGQGPSAPLPFCGRSSRVDYGTSAPAKSQHLSPRRPTQGKMSAPGGSREAKSMLEKPTTIRPGRHLVSTMTLPYYRCKGWHQGPECRFCGLDGWTPTQLHPVSFLTHQLSHC